MWSRLKQGLSKTSQRISQGLAGLFQASTLTAQHWDDLHDALIASDMGVSVADSMVTAIQGLGPMSAEDLRKKLVEYLTALVQPYERPLHPMPLVLAVGVNGSGKTTSLGKIGRKWAAQGHSVRLVAADTFRAAAVDQLAIWGRGLKITSGGSEPASVVFKGLQEAQEEGDDVVLIDTAGRLPNKVDLMQELSKIYKIATRWRPCEVILVLDATLGQHALVQLELFQKALPLNGVIMNKMDGTAKGGILFQVTQNYKLPIYGIGVGEKEEDLVDFNAKEFAEGLLG
jgi:fused signal recognition particle receptor